MSIATQSPFWWTTFVTETVDATGDVGEYASPALGPQSNPRIAAYHDHNNGALKFVRKGDAGWTIETVDVTGKVGWWVSLALDARGNPHNGLTLRESGTGSELVGVVFAPTQLDVR
jgi:hypothetical protein